MKLSIITINYNNAEGLCRTIQSVQSQTFHDFEHIIVDGGSTDGSVEVIEAYASDKARMASGSVLMGSNGDFVAVDSQDSTLANGAQPHEVTQPAASTQSSIKWISEKDKGVYDAQNKGIEIVLGKRVINDDHTSQPNSLMASSPHRLTASYLYFLNAGDTFCADDVLERIFSPNNLIASSPHHLITAPDIIYGNEVIVDGEGKAVGVARGVENPSFVDLYNSCMKHQASFIHCDLCEKYGIYDSEMRICSDFDWFFRVIAFHDDVTLLYKDIDIAYFENTGISYHNPELCKKERQQVLDRYMSKRMQRDYEMLGKYPRLSRVGGQKVVRLLLKIANRLLK